MANIVSKMISNWRLSAATPYEAKHRGMEIELFNRRGGSQKKTNGPHLAAHIYSCICSSARCFIASRLVWVFPLSSSVVFVAGMSGYQFSPFAWKQSLTKHRCACIYVWCWAFMHPTSTFASLHGFQTPCRACRLRVLPSFSHLTPSLPHATLPSHQSTKQRMRLVSALFCRQPRRLKSSIFVWAVRTHVAPNALPLAE